LLSKGTIPEDQLNAMRSHLTWQLSRLQRNLHSQELGLNHGTGLLGQVVSLNKQ